MEFDQIYEKIVSYYNIDQNDDGEIECHGTIVDKKERICIFCGKKSPDVTFKKIAHAVSETLGNKVLVSHYECDKCNLSFGSVLEDSLGKYIAPFKYISQIYGKKNTLTIKDISKDSSLSYDKFRMESRRNCSAIDKNGNIQNYIIQRNDVDVLKETEEGFSLKIPRQKYNPKYVYAALLKMGYSLLPFDDIQYWICDTLYLGECTRNFKSDEASKYYSNLPNKGILAFYAGKNPLNGVSVHLYRRKENQKESYCKYLFRLDFCNFSITIPIVISSEKETKCVLINNYQDATSFDIIDFTNEDEEFICEFSAEKKEIPNWEYRELEKNLIRQELLRKNE